MYILIRLLIVAGITYHMAQSRPARLEIVENSRKRAEIKSPLKFYFYFSHLFRAFGSFRRFSAAFTAC